MKKIVFFIALTLFATGNVFSQKKNTSKQKKSVSVKYDEEKALYCLSDYYSFYNANYIYQKAVIRRVSNNVFYISLQERQKESDDIVIGGEFFSSQQDHTFFWHAKVLALTITSSTKYIIKEKGF